MSLGERTFFAVATSFLTMAGMVILLVVVVGTFYLLLEYIVEKVRLRIEKKAETDESSEGPAEVRDPEQPHDSDIDRRCWDHKYCGADCPINRASSEADRRDQQPAEDAR